MGGFPLVHAFLTAAPDHALGVAQNDIFGPHAHGLDQLRTGDGSCTRAIDHELRRFQIAPGQMAGIDQAGGGDNRRAMLIIMKDRNIHQFAQALFNHKAFRRLDVFQIDAAKGRAQIAHSIDESVGVFGIHAKIHGIDIGKALEQSGLAFHHRLRCQRAQIAKPEHRRAIGNHRDEITLGCIVIGKARVAMDMEARLRDTWRIGQAQIPRRDQRLGQAYFKLAGPAFPVHCQRFFGGDARRARILNRRFFRVIHPSHHSSYGPHHAGLCHAPRGPRFAGAAKRPLTPAGHSRDRAMIPVKSL